jgi:hypothetical protein
MSMRTPPSRHVLDAALAQLHAALLRAEERDRKIDKNEPPPLTGEDAALADAACSNDLAAAQAALKSGANPNAGLGLALRIAAENDNRTLMKELVIRGAEVSVTVAGLRKENSQLSARLPWISGDDPQVREALRGLLGAINPHAGRTATDKELSQLIEELNHHRGGEGISPVDERRAKNDATIKLLKDWQKGFIENLSVLDVLRQQQKIIDELDALKKELLPEKLDKPKLAAPKPPQNG